VAARAAAGSGRVIEVLARRAALVAGAAGLALLAQGLWIPAKAQLAQILLERAFERSVATGEPQKPWPWADTMPVAEVEAERLHVSEVVLAGGSGQAMAFGPAELAGLPRDVRVFAGHRDTHFRFMRDLRRGDTLRLDGVDGSHVHYRIVGVATMRWDRFAYPAKPARPLLALATCYPFDAQEHGPLRRVAWAERIG